ncbi:hypothetical protein [Bacillus sinesaloumensis]|uniref:hypothetical protein n=1 Tax=Litchfieldia sinesaloumensis TaxID=1926280 RepID=UPI00115218BB|nr:hypothetical protein [Bacillus sinesaloumensis]
MNDGTLNRNLKKYLTHIASPTEQSNFTVLVFLLPAMFVLIPVLAPPFEMVYAIVVLPPFFIMMVATVWYRITSRHDGKRYQNTTFFLLKGVYGCVDSLGCLIIIQKFAYGMLGIQSIWFFVLSVLGYFVVLYLFFKDQIKKIYTPKKKEKKRPKKGLRISVSMFPALGYLVGTWSLRFVSDNTMVIVIISMYFMMSYIMLYHMLELHRYYLIKKQQKSTQPILQERR